MSNENNKNMQNKIPKIIHYVWVGPKEKSEIILKCIKSWKEKMPDYDIKLWNENNFNINNFEFTRLAYQNKKYAFVADYIRLFVLYNEGGIYLDTDMYALKNFDDFIDSDYELILGKEDQIHINAAMMASNKNNLYIKKLLDYYNHTNILEPIPKIMTRVFNEYKKELNINEKELEKNKIKIFESIYFYPYNADNIKVFFKNNFQNAPKESYAVHLWDYSWGHPLNKLIKKIGMHKQLKTFTEKLGIKNKIKNILKME